MRSQTNALRTLVGLGSLTLLLLTTSVANAKAPTVTGIEVQATMSGLQPDVSDRLFQGSGNAADTSLPATFAARGGELGLSHPWLATFHAELCLYLLRYLGIGLRFGSGWNGHADQRPGRPDLAFQVDSRALSQDQIGGVLRGVLPLGAFVTVRVSTFLGYRIYELPVTSFAQISCGKNGGGHCYPSATSEQFSAETRLEATVSLWAYSPAALLVFVGAELSPPLAFTMGAGFVFARYDLFARAPR